MPSPQELVAALLSGPLASGGQLPLVLSAVLCDLRPRFLAKGRVGKGYRAVARNGRILLASDLSLEALAHAPAQVRLQIWHKVLLPDDPPLPYGLLLSIRSGIRADNPTVFQARLATRSGSAAPTSCGLTVDVGGGMGLEFHREPTTVKTASHR
jgi:hypothetical protein